MTPSPPPPSGLPPAKKSNAFLWIVVGVGGFVVLVALVVLAAGLFLIHKAREAGLDNVTIENAKHGQFKVNSPDGSVQIGGDAKIPTWVPDYPGSNPQNAFSARGKDGQSGTFTFKTRDSADHVARFYREQLEGAGYKVAAVVNTGSSQVMTAEDRTKHRSVTVLAGGEGSEISVNITYATGK